VFLESAKRVPTTALVRAIHLRGNDRVRTQYTGVRRISMAPTRASG